MMRAVPIATWLQETYQVQHEIRGWIESIGVPTAYRLVSPNLKVAGHRKAIGFAIGYEAPQGWDNRTPINEGIVRRPRRQRVPNAVLSTTDTTPHIAIEPPFQLVLEQEIHSDSGPNWHVERLITGYYPWTQLLQKREFGNNKLLLTMERARRRLVWLIYDALGLSPFSANDSIMSSLMIPDIHKKKDWEKFLLSPENMRLTDLIRAHDDQNREVYALRRQWLTSRTSRSITAACMRERSELRAMIIVASTCVSESFLRTRPVRTVFYDNPYSIDIFSGNRHPGLSIRLAPNPNDDTMVWTLWSVPESEWSTSSPIASSKEGPLQLMHQAGLDVVGNNEWFAWLDQNTDPGELTFDTDAYALLGVQPLLWDTKEFTQWASTMIPGGQG